MIFIAPAPRLLQRLSQIRLLHREAEVLGGLEPQLAPGFAHHRMLPPRRPVDRRFNSVSAPCNLPFQSEAVGAGRCGCRRRRSGRGLLGAGGGASGEHRQGFFDGQQPAGVDQPQQPDFHVQPRLRRSLQVTVQIQRELQVPRQILFAEDAAISASRARSAGEAAIRRVSCPASLGHQQVAEVARQLAAEVLQVVPVPLQFRRPFRACGANRIP